MPCFAGIPAARNRHSGGIRFHDPPDFEENFERITLPCGKCLGCRKRRAQDWALRCALELSQHQDASWVTLTYADDSLPPSLSSDHLAGYLKRLRARLDYRDGDSGARRALLRFFAAGEYGERTHRPHYHVILFGVRQNDEAAIKSWPYGYVQSDQLTPAAIKYVVGYATKKLGVADRAREMVDPDTGEVLEWQPPFFRMSRRPGIGSHARNYVHSWRSYAIAPGGARAAVPRYLHQAWLKQATEDQVEELRAERIRGMLAKDLQPGWQEAAQRNALVEMEASNSRRKL